VFSAEGRAGDLYFADSERATPILSQCLIVTSDIIRASDSTYFVDIARV